MVPRFLNSISRHGGILKTFLVVIGNYTQIWRGSVFNLGGGVEESFLCVFSFVVVEKSNFACVGKIRWALLPKSCFLAVQLTIHFDLLSRSI